MALEEFTLQLLLYQTVTVRIINVLAILRFSLKKNNEATFLQG